MFRTAYLVVGFLLIMSICTYAEDVQYISFSSTQTGNSDIYIIDINGENLRNLTNQRRTNEIDATWSSDGRFFAYSSDQGGNFDIYVMDIQTEKSRRLTKDPGFDGGAAWSPDGQWIAFYSDRSGAYEIYKMDVRGKNLQRLTRHPGSNTTPAWSPDSQQILFSSFRRNEKGHRETFLYMMRADGENLRQFIKVNGGGAAWSPNGNQILFPATRDDADGEDTFDLFLIDTDGAERHQLTNGPKWELDPAWSPDGEWITFEAREPRQNKTNAIYVMNVVSGEIRQLTDELSRNWSPAWMPTRDALPIQPSASLLTTTWGAVKKR
ncbi:MAG: DPP IV N-terminal domain-containing protein [Candidatus Poribacteria bacterium]|nr:DPP IV N-terminal domain-containing protein [Candidatus Poribacteria bacterium]